MCSLTYLYELSIEIPVTTTSLFLVLPWGRGRRRCRTALGGGVWDDWDVGWSGWGARVEEGAWSTWGGCWRAAASSSTALIQRERESIKIKKYLYNLHLP